MLTQRNKKNNPNNSKTTTAIPRGIWNFFSSVSQDEQWIKLNYELENHLKSIYSKIHSAYLKEEEYLLLRKAYEENKGSDRMDALREKIEELYEQHRANISACERCGEITTCCCVTLGCVIGTIAMIAAIASPMKLPPAPPIMQLPDMDYGNPEHSKSPYKDLVKALNEYTDWYDQLPKYFLDGTIENKNFKTTCESLKKARLGHCDETFVPVSLKTNL